MSHWTIGWWVVVAGWVALHVSQSHWGAMMVMVTAVYGILHLFSTPALAD